MRTLSPAEQTAVVTLVERCRVADGVAPLNEQALLGVTRPGRHRLQTGPEGVLGYLQVGEDGTAQLCVDPGHRRRGLGAALALAAEDEGPVAGWWAFGALPPARAFAERRGLHAQRELLIMRRPLTHPAPTPPPPAGVRIRAFVPGQDEAEWLALNARVFAQHQEQGRLDADDLAQRMAQPWFDPAGFFLAETDARIVGYHWTKVHPASADGPGVGEVYVLGVDPDAAGGGLGRALLAHGLQHLRGLGLDEVVLYVEAAERRVVRLYESASFVLAHTDALFARASRPEEVAPR